MSHEAAAPDYSLVRRTSALAILATSLPLLWPETSHALRYPSPRRSMPSTFRTETPRAHHEEQLRQARREDDRGFFEEAAALYEEAAQIQQEAGAADALLRATMLRLGLGQRDEALRDAARYEGLLQGKTPTGTLTIALLFARHHADREEWKPALDRLRTIDTLLARGTRRHRIEAHGLRLRALAGSGDLRRAEAEARRLLALQLPRESTPEPIQEARVFLAERAADRARSIVTPAFRGPSTLEAIQRFHTKVVAPWFRKKREATEAAAQAHQGIQDQGASIRWAMASAAQVGGLWAQLFQEVRSLPLLPSGVSLVQTWPGAEEPPEVVLKQRAKQAFEGCLQMAERHRFHDENVARCEAWLARFHPHEHPENDGYRLPPILAGGLLWRSRERPLRASFAPSPSTAASIDARAR